MKELWQKLDLGFVRLSRADKALDRFRGFVSLSFLELVHPATDRRDHVGRCLELVLPSGTPALRFSEHAIFALDYFYNFLV